MDSIFGSSVTFKNYVKANNYRKDELDSDLIMNKAILIYDKANKLISKMDELPKNGSMYLLVF